MTCIYRPQLGRSGIYTNKSNYLRIRQLLPKVFFYTYMTQFVTFLFFE